MNILDEAFELKEYMVEQRNYFHSHPELGLQEFNTCNHIEEELNKAGIKNRRVAGTNVIAEIDSGRPGKTLFLRADIDALPIQDAKDVPYRSQTSGIMHACGHDGHAAYLLGAAKLILKHKSEFTGKVILAFQAAEEIGKGARDIIAAGVLDNVDRTFGIHFASEFPVGSYGIKSGADMASCDRWKIKIHGKAAHITTPQNGSDSLFIGALIATQLQTAESRKKMADAVRSIAQNVAAEYGATAYFSIEKRFMADNFADYSRKAPGTYVHVGSSDGPATSVAHHNEYFDLAEDSYSYAAALAVQYTLDYLC